jgi:hypothetical protein
MNLQEIEERVAQLDLSPGPSAHPLDASRLRVPEGSAQPAAIRHLQPVLTRRRDAVEARVFDRYVQAGEDLHAAIDDARRDERVIRERPRFLIVRDTRRLVAADTTTADTLDIDLTELGANAAFFLPWAGIEKTQLENLHYADVKRMARLYDEITKANSIATDADIRGLNVFFSYGCCSASSRRTPASSRTAPSRMSSASPRSRPARTPRRSWTRSSPYSMCPMPCVTALDDAIRRRGSAIVAMCRPKRLRLARMTAA